MSLLRSSAIIAVFTLISRVFGFVRDVVIANVMGAGPLTDAFFVAFKLPNFLRRLFAEGAFSAAFLPIFAGMLKVDGEEKAMRFASNVMTCLSLILVVISIIAIIFMPEILKLVAPGFNDSPELSALTADLCRITFPYLLFISLVSLLGGVINSHDKFAAVAFTPVFLNISLIGAALFLPPYMATTAHALAYGVLLAGLTQYLWLLYVSIRYKMLPKFRKPEFTEDVRKMLKAFLPVAFGAGVAQVNQLIDVVFATYLDTAISYLYYADRIYELPLGVIGIAVATALLPMLSRHVRADEKAEAARAIDQALRLTAVIGLPASAALIVMAAPITLTIYEHGAFTAKDSAAVIPALIAYSWGLPAFLMIKIFANCFFAAQNTKTPVKIAVVCLIANLILNYTLIDYYGHVGLALATTFAGWLNACLLGYFLHKQHIFRLSRSLIIFMLKISLAVAGMVIILLFCQHMIGEWFYQNMFWRCAGICLLISVGGATYFGLVIATKAIGFYDILNLLGKGRKAKNK